MIKSTDQSSSLSNNTLQVFKPDMKKDTNGLFNRALTLNDGKNIIIPIRDDGYVNITILCKASGKDIREWNMLL